MRSAGSAAATLAIAVLLAGCAPTIMSDTPVRIGRPYQVRGRTYVPAAQPDYDVLGYASWYGRENGQHRTSNGERYAPARISAAHATLPLPSYVEVTALDTGRTILVRINDRGPFSGGRIIDLSRGAAEELGVRATGHVAVRVRCVVPSDKDRLRLRKGRPAADRPDVPPGALAAFRARLAGQTYAAAQRYPAAPVVPAEAPDMTGQDYGAAPNPPLSERPQD